jgi:hypothetical protein
MKPLFLKEMATLVCLLLAMGAIDAQSWTISGRVLDKDDNSPLPFVNIIVAGQPYFGTSSDLDGYFELEVTTDRADLEFSYLGYQKKLIPFSRSSEMPVTIHLAEQADELAEVTVFPGENPAHRIIKNAVNNREVNNPENLPSFSYETYGKFVVTVNTDSLDTSIDTVYKSTENDSVMELDSSNYMLDEFMQKQHLLFMETVTERKYIKGKRDNEEVIASRMSGFKNPLFALINTQMQSFSFYDDYISIAGQELLNPITPGSTSRYFFLIRDTLYNSETDSVFVISFRPRPKYGFDPMQGVLYINTSNWAIQNVIARPVETEGVLIEIEQKYKRYNDRTWFPDQLNATVILGSASVNGATPEARLRTYLRNVQLGAELQPKKISKAVVTIADDARDKADQLLLQYRQDSLDSREARTYEFMDSISEAENLERGLDILISLAQGRIPLGPVDLVMDRLFIINQYEGFRPGLEFRTNNRFSNWLRLGAYAGYGFRDNAWKYDLYTNIILNKHSNLKLIAGHKVDILEAARQEFIQTPYRGVFQNNFRQFFVDQVDRIQRNYFGFTWDPWGDLGFMTMLHQEQRTYLQDYNYIPDGNPEGLGNQYNFTEAIFSLRYAPEEDFIEAPGYGRIRMAQKFPLIYFQYTRGLTQVLDGDFDYNKFDLLLHHQKSTLFLGELDLVMLGGLVLEELPYSKIYTGMSNMLNRDSWWERMGVIADRYSFETMRFNEFAYDRYIQVMFRQNLKTLLFRRDWLAPHVELVARGLWGFMASNAVHEGISFSVPERGYYEGGVELNQLLVSGFSGIGLGFYYRFGPYSLPTVEENFAAKITFSFAF